MTAAVTLEGSTNAVAVSVVKGRGEEKEREGGRAATVLLSLLVSAWSECRLGWVGWLVEMSTEMGAKRAAAATRDGRDSELAALSSHSSRALHTVLPHSPPRKKASNAQESISQASRAKASAPRFTALPPSCFSSFHCRRDKRTISAASAAQVKEERSGSLTSAGSCGQSSCELRPGATGTPRDGTTKFTQIHMYCSTSQPASSFTAFGPLAAPFF